MDFFTPVFKETLGIEGDFSDDPHDRGGATRYGITERVARKHGYTGDMRDLPLDLAVRVAKSEYWDVISGDDVAALSEPVARELFDTAYNMGTGTAGTFLQRALNAFNKGGKSYADLIIDHQIGPATVKSLREFLSQRGKEGETVLLRALNALQGARYIGIAEADVRQETFVFGWFLQRVKI